MTPDQNNQLSSTGASSIASSYSSESALTDVEIPVPGVNRPLIGNGPGYHNGEAILHPIMPAFPKKHTSTPSLIHDPVVAALLPPTSVNATTNMVNGKQCLAEPVDIAIPTANHHHRSASGRLASSKLPPPPPIPTSATIQQQQQHSTNGTNNHCAPAVSAIPPSVAISIAGAMSPGSRTPNQAPRGGADAGIVVVSGGTACNSLVNLLQEMTPNVTYVLGISDNGGSTSEILRVLDGPAIGDIRSRLIRLITPDETDIGRTAIQELLGYRLPGHGDESAIKNEWVEIVEGSHRLWQHIPSEKKEVIRGFLIYIQSEILKRAHKRFSFANGSIGNFFLTGARMFFGSLESAIFLFAAITGINEPTRVIPVINTNHGIAIAAQLHDGQTILGQCAISHPSLAANNDAFAGHVRVTGASSLNSAGTSPHPLSATSPESTRGGAISPSNRTAAMMSSSQQDDSFSTLKLIQNNIHFDKSPARSSSLQSRITRLYYINEYGQEIFPPPNPKLLYSVAEMETLIYSIGSLYTSIIPCLILKDVGRGIAESRHLRNKVFMLNGTNDRETPDYTAMDFIRAITGAMNASLKLSGQHWPKEYRPSKYITHLIYLDNSEIQVDTWEIEKLGIECVPCVGARDPTTDRPIYDEKGLDCVLKSILDGSWSLGNQTEQLLSATAKSLAIETQKK